MKVEVDFRNDRGPLIKTQFTNIIPVSTSQSTTTTINYFIPIRIYQSSTNNFTIDNGSSNNNKNTCQGQVVNNNSKGNAPILVLSYNKDGNNNSNTVVLM